MVDVVLFTYAKVIDAPLTLVTRVSCSGTLSLVVAVRRQDAGDGRAR